ncbi:EcsC protein family protein [compost metagenome]
MVAVYRDNFGWKKLFQMIPIAGMLFGAFINRGMLNDVAEAASMLYRKRRVLIKLAEGEQTP